MFDEQEQGAIYFKGFYLSLLLHPHKSKNNRTIIIVLLAGKYCSAKSCKAFNHKNKTQKTDLTHFRAAYLF